jgi:hypothetical protein
VRITRKSPGMRFFFARVFPLPFILIGMLIFYYGWRELSQARESTGWPSAEGTIQSSAVEVRTSRKSRTYHAAIWYQFDVDGQTHSGNSVSFGDYGSSSSSRAQNIVNRYPQGKAVRVYYLRRNPDTCVLEPGLRLQAWFLPIFGLIFFTAGTLMAILLPRSMRRVESGTGPEPGAPRG